MCGNCFISAPIPQNYNVFSSASKSNKKYPRDRTLDLLFFLRDNRTTSLKNNLLLARGESLPHWSGATFSGLFVLIYCLRGISLSAVPNRFEFEVSIKATVPIMLENLSLLFYLPSSYISS